MRFLIALVLLLSFFISCDQRSDGGHQHHSESMSGDGSNQELYEEVMAVHDEVMPKMNDLQKAKTTLQTRLQLPGLPESDRKEITIQIARIDSASEEMMVWMRQFQPPADSAGEEQARAYLEKELGKVKEVREKILAALETSPANP